MAYSIYRQSLVDLLQDSQRVVLTLLVGPAGSGKSTLIDQWEQAHPHSLIVRANLTSRHQSIFEPAKHILDELRKRVDLYQAPIFNLFSDQNYLDADFFVESVRDVLNSIDVPVFIVLDDYQFVDDELSTMMFSKLLNHCPEHVHFILCARRLPKLNIGKLKLDEQVLNIGQEQLELTRSEVQMLCKSMCGTELSVVQMDHLMHYTEGWLAGVKLALLAAREHGLQAIEQFNGQQPDVIEYFASEVYTGLSESAKSIYKQLSLFERFNDQVCSKVLGLSVSGAQLKSLMEQTTAFIIECSGRTGWYRYHSLMRDYLSRMMVQSESPEQIEYWHQKAASVFFELKELNQSAVHASKCKDREFSYRHLGQCCQVWLKQGRFQNILTFLNEIDEPELIAQDDLSLCYVYSLIFTRRFNQAHYFLDLLQEQCQRKKDEELSSKVTFFRLSLNLLQRDVGAFSWDTIRQLVEEGGRSDSQTFSLIAAAYYELQVGELAKALKLAHKAKAILSQQGYVFLESYADLLIALCDRYMGRGIEAVSYISSLYNTRHYEYGGLPWVSLSTGMVVVHYEQNQLKEAERLCEQLLPNLNHTCMTEVISTVYLSYSRLSHLNGETRRAHRLLDQLGRILILGKYDRFMSQALFESCRQAYVSQDYSMMKRLQEQHDWAAYDLNGICVNGRFDESIERKALGYQLLLRFQGDVGSAKSLLNRMIHSLNELKLVSRSIIAQANLLVCEFESGKEQMAISGLKQLIAEMGFNRISRNTFDEAPGLNRLLSLAEACYGVEVPDLFKIVYGDFFEEVKPPSDQKAMMSLTEKEWDIFHLLKQGLTNGEMAEQLGIALSTTKWHLKNIYQKLGVANRTEAIAKHGHKVKTQSPKVSE